MYVRCHQLSFLHTRYVVSVSTRATGWNKDFEHLIYIENTTYFGEEKHHEGGKVNLIMARSRVVHLFAIINFVI